MSAPVAPTRSARAARCCALACALGCVVAWAASCGGDAREPEVVVGPSGSAPGAGVVVATQASAAGVDERERAASLERGAALFSRVCSPCHGERGAGVVGPNLTDDAFLHGSGLDVVRRVVAEGVPDKGMPAWGAQLGERAVLDLATFVVSLEGQGLAGKAPQGERRDVTRARP